MKISKTNTVIDTRDINLRINELEDEIEELSKELQILKTLKEDCQQYSTEFDDGTALINENYFEEYTEELCNDMYNISNEFPYNHISWGEAAKELQQDYACMDFDNETFFIRKC